MKSRSVDLKQVTIDDVFWAPRIATAREVTIPFQWKALNDQVPGAVKSGAVRNFKIAAGKIKGKFSGCIFQDSDLAKWIEAAGHSLATHPDRKLERTLDGVIDLIEAAQEPDGYMVTGFIIKDRNQRWKNLRDGHELYMIGHMTEAAVACYRATGKRKLLDVVCRAVDNAATVLGRGKGKKRGYPGHEEIELALVKLYRATGRARYLRFARYFIDERGRRPYYFDTEDPKHRHAHLGSRWLYCQAHEPVREQTEAVGHAVRAMYLYSGMADVAVETGDKALVAACKRIWKSATRKRMYVTGGVGSSASAGEAFTHDYELPNEIAYTETCASIGLIFFARRMLELDVDSDYADVMERALYNGALSGISLDGQGFFYSNPLVAWPGSGIDGHRATRRMPWIGCACCPPNILRLLTSLGNYIYTQTTRELFVHLYVGGRAEVELAGQKVVVEQKTQYPWKEKVVLRVRPQKPAEFTVSLRIPGWCKGAALKVNGKVVRLGPMTTQGYARIKRLWKRGDRIELTLPMPAERVYPNPKIRHTAGVALQRGPMVYCLEQVDNGADLSEIVLPRSAKLRAGTDAKLFGGVPVITAKACRAVADDLYTTAPARLVPAAIKAVPYFVWANRTEGEMRVWLRERP